MNALKTIATHAPCIRVKAVFSLILVAALAGCSILPEPPVRPKVYDFGPGAMQTAPADRRAPLPPVVLSEITALGVPDASVALLYRLNYANDQQLFPYTQARWSQPPTVLMQMALRDRLSERRAVLMGDESGAQQKSDGHMPTVLRTELEEFSHVFTTPSHSVGLVRMRASLIDPGKTGDRLFAQRVFVVQKPAAMPDAASGAKALAEAASQLADEMAQWVEQSGR